MKILIVDNVRSLHNIGAFFRTCEGLGVDKIFLCGKIACPPRKEITKTALGAEELVSWEHFDRTLDGVRAAKDIGCSILSLELTEDSIDLKSYKIPEKWALVVGHELLGVDDEILESCDSILEIPMQGEKSSLNVSVATGIALYALSS